MVATHRVKDSDNKTLGFIIDSKFYSDWFIRNNIQYVDNVSINGL